MNPVHDSLITIREALEWPSDADARAEALEALLTLQYALAENQPLAAVAEGFCSEVEVVAQHRAAKGKGGQHVPCHSRLVSLGPSAFGALERYARDFRAAMERKPDSMPDVAAPMCEHMVHGGCFACGDTSEEP